MLKRTPNERWSVQYLFDHIRETNTDPSVLLKFSDHCCIDDDAFDDAQSSECEYDHTDSTKSLGTPAVKNGGSDWRRCYSCEVMVELKEGINPVTW